VHLKIALKSKKQLKDNTKSKNGFSEDNPYGNNGLFFYLYLNKNAHHLPAFSQSTPTDEQIN
jgi:hypothetical protein